MSSAARASLSAPAQIKSYSIASNEGKTAQLIGGIIKLQYFESLLNDTVSSNILYVDTGGAVDGKTVLDGLPLVGGEKSRFIMEDNQGTELEVTLYANNITPLSDDTHGQLVSISSVSKEYLLNEKIRLYEKFKGKISEAVKKILTDGNYLGTQKDISGIDDTFEEEYNFMGNSKKPFYTINWISKKAVPAVSGEAAASGKTAGFFFWETSEGYHFKSIDTLLGQEPKKNIIYNDTPDDCGKKVPEGYDIKALSFSKDNIQNTEDKERVGARDTRIVTFDPFNGLYKISTPNSGDTEDSITTGGEKLPTQNPELIRPGANKNFSRTTYALKDTGSLPSGTTEQQLEKSKDENLKVEKVLNQSIMRYNQFFSFKAEVVIPGDFSLHAGDAVYIDSPQQSDKLTEEVNEQSGGLYIITELCHYLDLNGTYTKLLLVRDSVERTPKSR
jgi:hypothetical protein|tara:strand:- start:741 stop:2075 length:1335 start_codon:yes stop_codon:yes gene_type:complete